MKAQNILKRFGTLLFSVLLGVTCMAMTAFASGNIETGHQGSLSVQFEENGIGFADVAFSIYRVADISEDGTYTLTGDFAQYPVRMENLDSSGWRALAQTLDVYAARDEIASLMTRQTGPDGSFQITGLSTGLYLISGGQYIDEDIVYTPEPMLVSIPGLSADGTWVYDIVASCKFEREDTTDTPVSRKVQKVWKDDGNEEKRPEDITVQLLEVSASIRERYLRQAQSLTPDFIYDALKIVEQCEMEYRARVEKRLCVEIMLIRLCQINELKKKALA